METKRQSRKKNTISVCEKKCTWVYFIRVIFKVSVYRRYSTNVFRCCSIWTCHTFTWCVQFIHREKERHTLLDYIIICTTNKCEFVENGLMLSEMAATTLNDTVTMKMLGDYVFSSLAKSGRKKGRLKRRTCIHFKFLTHSNVLSACKDKVLFK